ncbi:hypothetical protein Bca52824_072821 [Brassica carinata]|uniref:Uncharacterized protein n=1 Tax=Brassica carinata TaxID=52824 RepID=A0A8X7U4M6_BRACI|nr:hypothetical protein Bca52824_072821 [Brassica carinata]
MCCDSYVFTLIVFNSLLRFWEARNVKRGGELMWADLLFMEVNGAIIFVEITHVRCPPPAWLCEVEAEEEKKEGKKKTRKRVRFNLNVQTFEPTLPSSLEDEDELVYGANENIAQWKAVKAKPVRRVKQLMKENVEPDSDDQAKPLMKEIIVNTSLVDWLASPKTFHGNGLCKRSQLVISPTWKTGQKFHSDSPL